MSFSSIKWKHYINYIVIGAIALVFVALALTGNVSMANEFLMEKITIGVILAVSLQLVVGFLGELSLGHAGFMCVGAYLGGKVSVLLVNASGAGDSLSASNGGPWILLVSLIAGGLCAAVCGVIIGLPALRLKGDYLAIVTLAFGEIVRSIFQNTSAESFGGANGLPTPRYSRHELFLYALVLVLIMLAVIQNLLRSRHGRAITAIRDSEIAAKATGINVTYYKLLAFTVSAFFAGIAGVLYSFSNYTVRCDQFDYNYSIEILVMVVLGGMGSINGSIIAATLVTFLNVKLTSILTGDLAVLKNLLYALILVAIVIYNNAPAFKNFRTKYSVKNLFARIRKPSADPAKVREDEAKWDRVPTKIAMDELLSLDISVSDTSKPDAPKKGDDRT